MRKVVLAMLCMMRVMNTTLMLYMFIMDFMMVRRKPCIRVNPNVYQNQVDALNREVTLVEKVAIFLWIIGHHNKNRPTKFQFVRSGETVSRHFNTVLLAVLRLYSQLWYRPQPVPTNDPDHRWRWFKNCLGALDGTFVTVHPPAQDRARYRVCHRLESAAKCVGEASWVKNSTGTPTQSREEYFNMNHASARNVIERYFGVLKMRFAILRSCSYYPMRTQCRIVTACCLIHNLIKREMAMDPIEIEYTAWEQANVHVVPPDDYIDTIEPTTQWTEMRDNLVTTMYNNWLTNGPAAEEEGLLACMLEEFKDGSKWGAENGFKSGFFGAVEILFHKMFPGTTIRANPNIESKFHPKASGMNGRVFPMFLSWQLLFGKDRATGVKWRKMRLKSWKMLLMMYTDGRFVFGGADFIDLSTGGSQNASKEVDKGGGKEDSLTQAFGSYMSDTREVMEKLVNAVSSDHRLSERRQGVFAELEKLNLEIEDMLTANAMILATEEKLDEFYSVPERYRQQLVGYDEIKANITRLGICFVWACEGQMG
ncbi:hypothetical protein Acr_00g0019730 [Actinidia rufa]|uniref:DDE Tnp4 domain-containing protein n=1 Tax=Actinidia rufa TaxID=165716 RepID=A0A7J0DDK8_9ERIC|nr:hypothetical protein Acr_00g0019730 [Actinidia rufa]